MTDSALNFESKAQPVVKPNPTHYMNITARGAPFVATHRVNISSPGIDLRNEVYARSVDMGEPVVVEGILCADLFHPAVDVRKTMARYLEHVHSESLGFTVSPSARRTTRWRDADRRKPFLYAKEQACPHVWRNALMGDIIPPFLAFRQEDDLSEYSPKLVADAMPRMNIGQVDSFCVWSIVKAEHRAEAEPMWAQVHYFATLQELESVKFPIHVVEQRVGGLVIVPSDCAYQFVNIGSAQVLWSRTTPDCLEIAITSVLPRCREVGHPEKYKSKYIIDMALSAYTKNLAWSDPDLWMPRDIFMRVFKQVLEMYKDIVEEGWVNLQAIGPEWALFERPKRILESRHAQKTRICGFCQGDIWNCHSSAAYISRKKSATTSALDARASDGAATTERTRWSLSIEKAVCAWNESTVLAGSPGYETITGSWPVMILPSNNQDVSAASLAYKRHQSVDYRKECHICKSTNTALHFTLVSCAFCTLSFCELCLEAYYEMDWAEIASKQAGWKCIQCQKWCPCAFDKRRALMSCIPLEDGHRRRLSLPAPVHDGDHEPSLPESVRDPHDGDFIYGAEQLIQEIMKSDKDDSRQDGSNNDQEL
ncbi:hypothetical protein BGZ47_004755 [Haplosporangium gracile]|nr:hypothetical protein BGZ47_004755 [Haplosporangium gracile]